MKRKTKTQKGFTLIELLMVIAIIGILSSIVLVNLNGARTKAQDAVRKQELQSVATAVEAYYAANGSYPIPSTDISNLGSKESGSCISSPWWNCWSTDSEYPFLPAEYGQIPQDPTFYDSGGACGFPSGNSTLYSYWSNGQEFVLATYLASGVSSTDQNYYHDTYGCTGFANWAIKGGF